MRFTKMEGAGNDYVYINLFEETLSKPEKLAVEISHRRFGVGADGLVLIAPSQTADLRMIMYNADGSQAEMCGNAIRCVGKYAWDHGLVKSGSLSIETGAGVKELSLNIDPSNRVESASVLMGVPELKARRIPSTLDGDRVVDHSFQFGEIRLRGTLVSMGNPHLVTYVEDVREVPVDTWGPLIENSKLFPNRINIEFVQVVSRTEVRQRTWERGSGETWACGTGASAVCVAGVLNDRTDSTIVDHLTGGDLKLTWKGDGHQVVMEGPAREVFSGTWNNDYF
ncbi:MAG: diaminopimelate epimerase [Proteobacteria bacterium]|nr:diaminopimelate epimerase [Pseudomonadota bacterium]